MTRKSKHKTNSWSVYSFGDEKGRLCLFDIKKWSKEEKKKSQKAKTK